MNEELWQSGMNSSSIFTAMVAVCDRRFPSGQLLPEEMPPVMHELCCTLLGPRGARDSSQLDLQLNSPAVIHPRKAG